MYRTRSYAALPWFAGIFGMLGMRTSFEARRGAIMKLLLVFLPIMIPLWRRA